MKSLMKQVPVSFHVILQVTSKGAIVLSILEWTKLGLDRWMIFPKSPGWGVNGDKRWEPGCPGLGSGFLSALAAVG